MKKTFIFLCFLCISIGQVSAQDREVRGVVISAEDNQPIIQASVFVKGQRTIGTSTDFDGNFVLKVPADAKFLEVSYVGMLTKEVAIKPNMRIILESDSKALDEVIVIAYGTAKKSTFTGSATSLSAASIEKRPITNVTQALAGAVSGLQVGSASGQPGSGSSMRIRGFGSINAGSSPLIIVDGSMYSGSISDINSSDIENLTVLKDAASTSLYGSSAGNGVILITTKKGKSQKPTLKLDITQGFSKRAIKEYELIGVNDYYPIMWEQLKNEYISHGKTDEDARNIASKKIFNLLGMNPYKGVPNDEIVLPNGSLNPNATELLWGDDLDWYKELERTGHRQQYNLSYNSASENKDSYVSLSYLKENGYVIKSDFERFSGRANINMSPTKWLKTGFNISATRSKSNATNDDSNTGYANPFYFIRSLGPIYPVYLHDPETGAYTLGKKGEKLYDYDSYRGTGGHNGRHVIAESLWDMNEYTRDAMSARTYADFKFNDHLTATINVSADTRNYKSKGYDNKFVGDGAPSGRMKMTHTKTTNYTVNQLLKWKRDFNEHHFDAILGHENYSYKYEYQYGMKQKEILSGIYELVNFVDINSLTSYTNTYAKEGFFTRINYDYADKYYGSFSYRRDGSSRFHKDMRWGNFFSFGASWRIDQESFMQDLDWVNSLKLRASYGETGSDDVGQYYPYKTLYDLGENNGKESGTIFYKFGNKDLKWETQVSWDVALDFSLFGKINGTLEYFNKESRDLLFSTPIPISSGSFSIWKNIGKVKNSGIEITLNGEVLSTKDVRLSLGANATFLKNKIIKLPEENREDGIIDGSKKLLEGKSIYDFWLRKAIGVNPENGDLMYALDTEKFPEDEINKDVDYQYNGQWITTDQNRALYHYNGSAIPTVYGGFNVDLTVKGIFFKALFNYQLGGKLLDYNYSQLMDLNSYGSSMHKDILNRWQKNGDQTDIPRLDASISRSVNATSDRFLISSDYLSLRSVSLGYNLPKSLIEPLGLENVGLSINTENLWILTKRKGMNPIQSFSGVSSNKYIPAKTITFGISLTI